MQNLKNFLSQRILAHNRVAIHLDNSKIWLDIDKMLTEIGVVIVPIPHFFSSKQVTYMLESAGIDKIICGNSFADVAVLEFNKTFSNKMLLRTEIYQKEYSHTQPYYENIFNNLHVLPELYFDRSRITPDDSSATVFEISLSDQSHEIKWSASYVFSDVHDIIDTDFDTSDSSSHQTQSRSWDQHHAFKFNVHIPIKSWYLDVIGNYHSGWPKTNIIESADGLQIGQRNKDTYDYHLQFDFKLSKYFKTEKGLLKMSIQANNIFNNANQCCVNYDFNEGRLTQKQKQWLPIVPNFSLIYYWN